MSTKTTFKRIALVAVAALGLGVLSVAPSSAATSGLTITASGTATAGNTAGTVADTTTAAMFTINGLTTDSTDTISVTIIRKSAPTLGAAITAHLGFVDTSTVSTTVGGLISTVDGMNNKTVFDSKTAVTTEQSAGYILSGSAGYKTARFSILLDTATVPAAGSYVYTVVANAYTGLGSLVSGSQVLGDVTITVAALSTASLTVAPASSTAFLGAASGAKADEVLSAVSTASTTAVGVLSVRTYNAAGVAAPESITATISGAGLLSFGGIAGSSLTIAGTGTSDISVLPNGTAGVATITVSTTSATFAPKTVTFYAKAAKTLTAAVYNPVLKVGANAQAVAVTAVDANGSNWAGQAYIVASSAADALVGGSATTPVACSYSATYKTHFCPVTTIATGTAKFKVIDASTVALATATSNEVTVTVSNSAPTSVKLAFDKSTYAPFEKALITVTVLGADGKTLQGQTFTNLFAAGGITSTYAFGASSDTLTAVTVTTDAATSASSQTTAGAETYVVYMPASGDVTITATGGTALAAAGQVAVSAKASVVNSSVDAATDAANEATDAANAATDAALAAADAADAATAAAQDASDAVAALSATVATLVASLKAQITSLTNLVIKIQKKVKA